MNNERIKLNMLQQEPYVKIICSPNLIEIPLNQTNEDIQQQQQQQGTNNNTSAADFNDKLNLIPNEENEVKTRCYSSNSLSGTSFNFINSIIGSGVISMPFAFQQAGVGMTIILLILVALLTDYSILILIKSGEIAGVKTYQDLVHHTMGKYGYILLITVQFFYPFICNSSFSLFISLLTCIIFIAALISYNIIIGDTITKILTRLLNVSATSIFYNRNFVVFICSILVTLPLSLYRNISKLAKTSLLSVVFLLFILIIMIIKYFELKNKITQTSDAWTFTRSFNGIIDSFSIMAFGFMTHHNSFLLYLGMKNDATINNWSKVTHSSISVAVVFSTIFGLIGYMTFTGYTEGDLFENYCHNDDLMNIVRFIYATIIMFTFPLECFVVRDVIENTFFEKSKGNLILHVAITVSIVLITFFLSMITDCLGIVLELNGSMIATILAYVLPSLCAIIINKRYRMNRKAMILPLIVCIFGIFVAFYGLISIIYKISNSYSCSHGQEPSYCIRSNITFNNFTTNFYSNFTAN